MSVSKLSLFKKIVCAYTFSVFAIHCTHAQQLDAIGKQQALKIGGGVSLQQIGYFASGLQEGRRDPYNFYLSGNVNIDLYGWSVPFSFNYSNQSQVAFSQPFNQYGLTPTYKWVTGHVGYASMNFSSYTLAGHLFNGVGVDLAPPGKFKFSAMYGRLQKAVEADTLHQDIVPAYRRMGYGFKATYGSKKDLVDVILFSAKDDVNSIAPLPAGYGYSLTPQENVALGLNLTKQLMPKLIFKGEVAMSMLTRDSRAEKDSAAHRFAPTFGLINRNNATAVYNAYKGSLAYGGKTYTLGVGYERVAPEYKTLGAYYFTNDFENITGNLQLRLLKGKLTTGVNAGVQHDNLNKAKSSTMRRWVSAMNATYAATKKLNLNFSYSNFQSFVNIRSDFDYINSLSPYENLDTLNYVQISSNATVGVNYRIKQTKEQVSMVMCNLSFMKSSDKQGGVTQNTGATLYNLNTSYNLQLVPKSMTFTLGFNANRNSTADIQTMTLGPTFGVNKALLNKKLRTSGSLSWNGSYRNGTNTSKVLSARATGAYTIKKVHSLNLSIVGLNRSSQTTTNMSELTTTLGYSYNF